MKRAILWFLVLLLGGTGLYGAWFWWTLPEVGELADTNPGMTAFMTARQRSATAQGESFTLRHRWIPLSAIPKRFQRTMILAEDAAFWKHEGIDWHELEKAMQENWDEGRIVRGASTITQQTAKNLYLSEDQTLLRKLREALIAQRLEAHLSKARILEIYLNIIEWGSGIFGIHAAAAYYFGKRPDQLNLSEMVRLAAVVPAPLKMDPRNPSGELRWRSRVILQRLRFYEDITRQEFERTRYDLDAFFGLVKERAPLDSLRDPRSLAPDDSTLDLRDGTRRDSAPRIVIPDSVIKPRLPEMRRESDASRDTTVRR